MKTFLTYLFLSTCFLCTGQGGNDFLFPLGNLKNESYKADSLKNGYVIDTFPNGVTKYIAFYVNGTEFGKVYNFFDHGKIESYGTMLRGKKIGLWQEFYYMNGKPRRIVDYSNKEEKFKYEINYYQSGGERHTTIATNDLYTHYEYYLKEDGDTQYLHKVVDSINKIYTFSEFHAPGKPSVTGYKQYSLGAGWEKIGTWKWFKINGDLIRKREYSTAFYGVD